MANVAHSTLTAANLHEPKGVATATAGQVYIANGAGSGAWTTITGLVLTGQVADWATPVAPSGWLECNGADVSTTTYAALYNAMTIQQTGNRTGGSAVITGLSDTSQISPGYYVFGTGINSGTTVAAINSATQITLSANATSSGTATVVISPYFLSSGLIRLPNLTGTGRYRRSRTLSLRVGLEQGHGIGSHNHPLSGGVATGLATFGGGHSHSVVVNLNDPGHTHAVTGYGPAADIVEGVGVGLFLGAGGTPNVSSSTTGITVASAFTDFLPNHQHTLAGVTDNNLASISETRPDTHVFLTCVKT